MSQTSFFETYSQAPPPNSWKAPTELPDLSSIDSLSLDCEATSLNFMTGKPVGLSISYRTDQLNSIYLPFGHSEGNMDEDRVKHWARCELAFKRIVFANAKYDCHMMRNWGVNLEELGIEPVDVQFAGALIDDNRYAGLGLDVLGNRYLGEGKLEFVGSKDHMADKPSWAVGPYAERDSSVTLRLDETFLPILSEQNLLDVYSLENSLIYIICEIEKNGSRLNRRMLETWSGAAIKQYDAMIREIHRRTGIGLNPNATESMESLFKYLGLPIPKEIRQRKRKDGSTYEETITSFTADNLKAAKHPVIDMALNAKRLDSLRSKYLDPFCQHIDKNNDIFFALHQLKSDEAGTVSGRFSSSGGGDERSGYCFNVQQVSKKNDEVGEEYPIRELFIPDDGSLFFSCDARQIEYRLFAHFSQAKSILAAYANDPYTQYHNLVWDMLKQAGSTIDYQQTKNTNFARLYGAGAAKIAKMIKVPIETAKLFLEAYDRVMPEAGPFLPKMSKQAERDGYVATLLGRRARFAEARHLHKAVNRLIQGSAADLMKLKMVRLYKERKTLGITKLRQVVHDEQDGDIDPDPKYAARLQECFDTQEMQLKVPILWELNTGLNWKACK